MLTTAKSTFMPYSDADINALLAFSMLKVSGFATSRRLVESPSLIMAASESSRSMSSSSLFMTPLLGAGILASGWNTLAKPEKRPASPLSLRPMLPISFGKYR